MNGAPTSIGRAFVAETLSPPESFGIVEPQVYRSNLPNPLNFSFLRQLSLRTVLLLSQEIPTRVVTQFFDENGIELVHLGLRAYKTPESTWRPCPEELVKDALELVLTRSTHPLLVCDASGIHAVGVLVGCLRKLLGWNLNSIVNEYRSYAGTKTRYVDEQFIELFDTDLVHPPFDPDDARQRSLLPPWYVDALQWDRDDRRQYADARQRGALRPDHTTDDQVAAYQRYYFALAAAPLCSEEE
ncbi:hypothetical protein CDCA_CDCA05G1471 [Cyanidium caldarium]|uniref:Uncharacterized protein n=1 Tax=Cyanidium caldarium TaxID=2771 RepID=A0AAV9ITE3_CYACA|nr:hypothetical protein CDCA_CDCA05G1471 [Cyanidium caldarium]